YALGGGAGLIALKLAVLMTMLAAVLWAGRTAAGSPMTRDLLVGLVVFGTVPQANHVRPQLFSLALFAWVLAILVASACGRTRRLWLVVPIVALWANLHGGWIVAVGALSVWASVGWLTSLLEVKRVGSVPPVRW